MTTLFLDEFNGSGNLANRVPNIGTPWPADATGVISSGALRPVDLGGFASFSGSVVIPSRPTNYAALSIYFDYEVLSSSEFFFELLGVQNLFGPIFTISNFPPPLKLLTFETPLLVPTFVPVGVHRCVISFDYTTGNFTVYEDDQIAFDGVTPGLGVEEKYRPTPGQSVFMDVAGGASAADVNRVRLLRIEVTDTLHTPIVPPFWTNRVQSQEVL